VSFDYLCELVLDERLVGDEVEESDAGSVECQDVLGRDAGILQVGVDPSNLGPML
jgi:hypothetical protein